MIYYKPLELIDDQGQLSGTWRYSQNRGKFTFTIGYCPTNKCFHLSAIEASDCYRDYIKNEKKGILPNGKTLSEVSPYGTLLEFETIE